MAHNINTYIGRQSAWHSLGTVVGNYLTWDEILQAGGLDYNVFKSQLHDGLGRAVNAFGTFRWNQADKALKLKDKAEFLGVVGADYKVIQHSTGFELIDALMATTNGAHYETAGVLGKGEVVWGLADLNLGYRIGEDEHRNYLLMVTSHDGSYSYQLRGVDERVVCNNTLDVALSEKTKSVFKVRHTKNAGDKIIDAQKALSNIAADSMAVQSKLSFLVGRKVTKESMTKIMDRLFPPTKKENSETGKVEIESSTRRENILSDVLSLYESNDRNAFPEQRGTAYNLLNAVTEYTDHGRSTRNGVTGRSESAMFGSGKNLKSQALQVILETASGMPEIQTMIVYPTCGGQSQAQPQQFGGLLDDVLMNHN